MQSGYTTDRRISHGTAVRIKLSHPNTIPKFAFADSQPICKAESDAALQPARRHLHLNTPMVPGRVTVPCRMGISLANAVSRTYLAFQDMKNVTRCLATEEHR